ncbi:MAG: hypothetical protein J0I06_24520 [Planctomycetes bacterium]|nr:hypothetical protein [Planctomycetota bacterium]
MDPLSLPDPAEREDVRLRPLDGWNQAVFDQILVVVQQALTQAPPPSEVPFVEPPDDAPKPAINITRVLHRAEQDLAASEKLVKERARVAEQPDAEARVRQWITTADAKLVAAVQRLLALGARPEVVAEVVAGVLAGERE